LLFIWSQARTLSLYGCGKRGDTVVDVEALKANAKKVRYYCVEHADVPLVQAVQEIEALRG